MTYRKFTVMLFVSLATISFEVMGQQAIIYLKAIGGTYSMRDMKKFQELATDNYIKEGKPAKVTSRFPFSVQGETGVDFETGSLTFGGWINYSSVKGELVYTDNSFPTTITHHLYRISIGTKVSKIIYKGFATYGKVGFNSSTLTIKTSNSSEDNHYLSGGGALELGGQWKYSYSRFKLITNIGYEVGLYDHLTDQITDSKLKNAQGESVKVNWNGLRVGVGMGFGLSFAKTPKKAFVPKTIEVD